MPKRHRPTLRVDDGRIEPKPSRRRQRHGGESLVDLPHDDVRSPEPLLIEQLLRGHRGDQRQVRRVPGDAGGTITAGNAPGVNDGAAALVLASAEYASANGVEVLAEIVDHAAVAQPLRRRGGGLGGAAIGSGGGQGDAVLVRVG